jgi:hypothetical protein
VLSVAGRSNGTPWVAADGDLAAVVWGATANGATDVMVALSRDGGETFGAPVRANTTPGEARLGGELPPRVAIRRGAAGSEPELTVVWMAREGSSVKIAQSRDGGRTFQPAASLQARGAAGARGWPALTLDPGGTAHTIWLDHRGLAAAKAAGHTHADHKAATAPHDGVAMAQKSGLYYASLRAGTASPERELARGVCYCCKTALASTRDGALFAAWRHVYPGNLRDIAFAASRDGGATFSAPARVSHDDWAINGCPDDGPALAVDARGTVHVVWPSVIDGAEPQGALFYASSGDGATFTPRVRIPTLGSPKPSHPQIAVDGRGRVAIAWDEIVEGRRAAVVREMKGLDGQTPKPGPVVMLSTDRAALYPVLAATSKGFLAVWTSGASGSSVIGTRVVHLP